MQKDTTKLRQLLRESNVKRIQFLSFTFQYRINGVECEIIASDTDEPYEISEEIAELLRDEITSDNLSYQDIVELFPKPIELIDFEGTNMRENPDQLGFFEVQLGSDS